MRDRGTRPALESPSPYQACLASAPKDYLIPVEVDKPKPYVYEPIFYFFYSTLTQPEVLKRILDLDHVPKLRPAKIIGYSLTAWGQYKALIDGEPGEAVFGSAYIVQSPEDEYKLAYYETNAYRLANCWIRFLDEQEPRAVGGNTFMYAGDAQASKEGRFDRLLWELQMGVRLPPSWDKAPTRIYPHAKGCI